jgi:hypothetical protein
MALQRELEDWRIFYCPRPAFLRTLIPLKALIFADDLKISAFSDFTVISVLCRSLSNSLILESALPL